MPKVIKNPLPPRVYCFQQPKPKDDGWKPNLAPATKFGSLEFVFPAGERIFHNPNSFLPVIEKKLKDFNPDTDCLLWVNFGDPAILWASIMMLVSMGHKRLKFLYWSGGRAHLSEPGYYFPVEIDVANFQKNYLTILNKSIT